MLKTHKKVVVSALLGIGIIAMVFGGVAVSQKMAVVGEAWQYLLIDYVNKDELDTNEMGLEAFKGMLKALIDPDTSLSEGAIEAMIEVVNDPYTSYLDAERYQIVLANLTGEFFEGIGVWFTIDKSGQLVVIAPIADSPAEEAGIKAGDLILKINGQSTSGMTSLEASSRIRGAKGTEVTLTVLHEGDDTPVEITITRDEITVPGVWAEVKDSNILYIRIYQFTKLVSDELTASLNDLLVGNIEDIDGIILDLRDNPGGYVHVAVAVASQFLYREVVVLWEEDSEGVLHAYFASPGGLATDDLNLRLAVLVNGGSASSSEIVAGALQDERENTALIGTTTFGKGAVNHIWELSDGSALIVTCAYWLTPDRRQINGQGLIPDIEITVEDEQLEAAIDYINNP